MVVFTCQHCGGSVQKTKVEKHYSVQCHNKPYLTCADCLKDFRGDAYVAHTQCVTEAERYGGKGYVPKVPSSVRKRTTWLSSVESTLEAPGLTKVQRDLLEACLNNSNVPQKKKKFQNFVKSSLGRNCPSPQIVESVFNLINETHTKNIAEENGKNDTSELNTSGCDNSDELADKSNNESVEEEKNEKRKRGSEDEGHSEINTSKESGKKEKKKKKKHKNEMVSDGNVSNELDGSSSQLDESLPLNDGSNDTNAVDNDEVQEKTLSKKERKEKKKREKYEAELHEIENVNKENGDDADDNTVSETNDETKRKKKKRDKNKAINGDNLNGDTVLNENGNKKKRRHEGTSGEEPIGKKAKDEETTNGVESVENGTTFKWDELIITVLQARPDKELSLNRLSKKLINEYFAIYGETHMTAEKLHAKFTKKVYKTPGVKVLKDKAKLIHC